VKKKPIIIKGLTVLCIDDSAQTRSDMKRELETRGINVVTVESAEKGINEVKKDPYRFAAIFMDLDLGAGRISGIKATIKLKKFFGKICPPIIIVSGKNTFETAQEVMKAGARNFVAKSEDYLKNLFAPMYVAIEGYRAEVYNPATGLYNNDLFPTIFNLTVRARKVDSRIAIMRVTVGDATTGLAHDKLGFDYQEKIMKIASRRLRKAVKPFNCKLSYAGSYDMTVILPLSRDDEREVFAVAGKIADRFKPSFFIDGIEYPIESTIGIGICPLHGDNVNGLLGATIFTKLSTNIPAQEFEQHYREACELIELKNYLHEIVDGDGHQLVTYFQAQVIKNGSIVGLEALVRLTGKDGGMVSPAKFIPVAQRYKNIISWIDKIVREQACKALEDLRKAGFSLNMSTNITFQELEGPKGGFLKANLEALLKKHGLSPSNFNLEITEDAAMHGGEATIAIIKGLKEAGILISIDDFGTGYANFAYLKKLSIHVIKIPRELVQDINTDQSSLVVLQTIIFMAEKLKLKVVAEGVETVEQEKLLFKLCPKIRIQGFYRSKPLPQDKTIKYLTAVEEHFTSKKLPWCFKDIEPYLADLTKTK
jgi:EAL domain-containing protein (putative c-di-GMP-specific phosphodiesterase class I)/ActR/RegA family two-component response regulator